MSQLKRYEFDFSRCNRVAVFGYKESGKTTLLLSLAARHRHIETWYIACPPMEEILWEKALPGRRLSFVQAYDKKTASALLNTRKRFEPAAGFVFDERAMPMYIWADAIINGTFCNLHVFVTALDPGKMSPQFRSHMDVAFALTHDDSWLKNVTRYFVDEKDDKDPPFVEAAIKQVQTIPYQALVINTETADATLRYLLDIAMYPFLVAIHEDRWFRWTTFPLFDINLLKIIYQFLE